MYPYRIIHKDTDIVYVGGEIREDNFTGITVMSWNPLHVTSIYDTGLSYIGSGMLSTSYVDWEKLHLYRILVIRKGRSRWPGRSWQMVERWYLHRINVQATIKAWSEAVRNGEDPDFYRKPVQYERSIQ